MVGLKIKDFRVELLLPVHTHQKKISKRNIFEIKKEGRERVDMDFLIFFLSYCCLTEKGGCPKLYTMKDYKY